MCRFFHSCRSFLPEFFLVGRLQYFPFFACRCGAPFLINDFSCPFRSDGRLRARFFNREKRKLANPSRTPWVTTVLLRCGKGQESNDVQVTPPTTQPATPRNIPTLLALLDIHFIPSSHPPASLQERAARVAALVQCAAGVAVPGAEVCGDAAAVRRRHGLRIFFLQSFCFPSSQKRAGKKNNLHFTDFRFSTFTHSRYSAHSYNLLCYILSFENVVGLSHAAQLHEN